MRSKVLIATSLTAALGLTACSPTLYDSPSSAQAAVYDTAKAQGYEPSYKLKDMTTMVDDNNATLDISIDTKTYTIHARRSGDTWIFGCRTMDGGFVDLKDAELGAKLRDKFNANKGCPAALIATDLKSI